MLMVNTMKNSPKKTAKKFLFYSSLLLNYWDDGDVAVYIKK
jgi:hypothetical protein